LALPDSLVELHLFLAHCRNITCAGATELSNNLPASILELELTLSGTQVDKNFESPAQLRKYVNKNKNKGLVGSLANMFMSSTPNDETPLSAQQPEITSSLSQPFGRKSMFAMPPESTRERTV
jgi:hypothetical protein